MECPSCKAEVSVEDAFCGDCGVRLAAESESEKLATGLLTAGSLSVMAMPFARRAAVGRSATDWFSPENSVRAGAGVLLALLLFWVWYSGGAAAWTLVLTPLILGALIALARIPALATRTEPWGDWFGVRRARAQGATGRFSRFFLGPMFASASGIWKLSRNVSDPHLRAGVRVAALLYLAGLALGTLVIIGYVLVLIVVIIIAIIITFWLLSYALEGGSSSGSRVARSVRKTGFFGGQKTVHYNEVGSKLGESRQTTDFFGRPRTEHFDALGRQTGRSEAETDFFGDERVVHRDEHGRKVGMSRPEVGLFGDEKIVHYDERGYKTGESRHRKGLFGDDVVEHFDEHGNKIGETRDE